VSTAVGTCSERHQDPGIRPTEKADASKGIQAMKDGKTATGNKESKKEKGIDNHVITYALPKQMDEFRRRDITISDGLVKFHYERLINLYKKALVSDPPIEDKEKSKKIKIRTFFDKNGYLMIKKI
jgi:hypothetical protein